MVKISPNGYPWLFLFGVFALIMPFQNCAPTNMCGSGSAAGGHSCFTESSSTNKDSSKESTTTRDNGFGGIVNVTTGERVAGSGNSGSNGSSGGGGLPSPGSGGTGGGGAVIIGDGGGGSGGGNGGGSSVSEGRLRFLDALTAGTVYLGENMQIRARVGGGTPPYDFTWYKDGTAITDPFKWTSLYSDYEVGFAVNGLYHAEVRDRTWTIVKSANLRITVQDRRGGCRSGDYFNYTNATADAYDLIPNYFKSPAGKYLLHSSLDKNGVAFQAASFFGLVRKNIAQNLPYDGDAHLSCRESLPHIHTPRRNPETGRTTDGEGYVYSGRVSFKCRNNKLLLVSNTCEWVRQGNSSGSGSGSGLLPRSSDR